MLFTGEGGSRTDGWNGRWSAVKAKCLEIQVLSPSLWSVLSLALQIVLLIAVIAFASCLHLDLSSLQGTLPRPPPLPDRLASDTAPAGVDCGLKLTLTAPKRERFWISYEALWTVLLEMEVNGQSWTVWSPVTEETCMSFYDSRLLERPRAHLAGRLR